MKAMAETEKHSPVTLQELFVSSLAQTDALAKLLGKALDRKGRDHRRRVQEKLLEERATYQRILNPTLQ
jgi:hypothetical protein